MGNKAPLPIAILTLNPCLDVSYEFPSLVPDQKVRADHTRFDPGGNGINVGRALKRLGLTATTCCILGGEVGNLVERLIGNQVADLEIIRVSGETRINCTILEKHPRAQYELDGIGPNVGAEALKQISERFLEAARGGYAVLTGSLPNGVPEDIYGTLVGQLNELKIHSIVDARGAVLNDALSHHPFLIKPNLYELELHCGRKLHNLEQIAKEARRIQETGVSYVCVSLGGDGAILVGPRTAYHAIVPPVHIRSTVGAGDSMVGGLVAAFAQSQDPAEALRLGVCCGSGTAQKPGTELFDPADIDRLAKSIEIQPVSWKNYICSKF
jgi:6-phosphofructokinase 2